MSNLVLRIYYPISKNHACLSHSNILISRWPKDLRATLFQSKLPLLYLNFIYLHVYFLYNNHFILSFGFRVVLRVAKTTIIRLLSKDGIPHLKTQKQSSLQLKLGLSLFFLYFISNFSLVIHFIKQMWVNTYSVPVIWDIIN